MKFTDSRALIGQQALTAQKLLLALILAAAAVLMACGGDTSGPASAGAAKNAALSTLPQWSSGVPAVSLSMDDYLGSTVVLYFSFPG